MHFGNELAGLDDVLIGLRTRELLQRLVGARCKVSPVLILIEDLHWTDSASEELLGKIVDGDSKLRQAGGFSISHRRVGSKLWCQAAFKAFSIHPIKWSSSNGLFRKQTAPAFMARARTLSLG